MRSIARCVLPVLVGPSTAVTLRMRAARSRLIRKCPQWATKCRQALQRGVTRSRGGRKKTRRLRRLRLPAERPPLAVDRGLCFRTIAGAILRHALDGDDLLGLLRLEYAHALRVASRDAHVIDGHADQLAGVGDQHDLVALFHSK